MPPTLSVSPAPAVPHAGAAVWQRTRLALLAVVLALPWLWPFTSGPLAAVQPYLISAAAAALALALWPRTAGEGALAAARGWLLAAAISSVIALLQYFDAETPFYPWFNIAQPGQAFGNLRQPNQLATLLVIGLAALRYLAHEAAGWRRTGTGLLAALLLCGLAATASRAGLLELLLLAAAALLWMPHGQRRRALLAALAAIAIYALAALALPALLQAGEGVVGRSMVERLQHAESTCGSRLILWGNVAHLIAQKPWLGWGWGSLSWAHYSTLYPGARFCHLLDNAHNLPLHLAVSLGVPAAIVICALLAALIWRARPWTESNHVSQLAWGILLAIGVHSMVEYPMWYGQFQTAAIICIWLLWVTRATRPTALPAAWAAPRRIAGALLILAAVGYTGWDYMRISWLYRSPEASGVTPWPGVLLTRARRSILFAEEVGFAELTTQVPTRSNAEWMLARGQRMLHYSPEPRVITRVLESAVYLRRDDVARAHMLRFRAAFPKDWQKWSESNERQLRQAQAALAAGQAAASMRQPAASLPPWLLPQPQSAP